MSGLTLRGRRLIAIGAQVAMRREDIQPVIHQWRCEAVTLVPAQTSEEEQTIRQLDQPQLIARGVEVVDRAHVWLGEREVMRLVVAVNVQLWRVGHLERGAPLLDTRGAALRDPRQPMSDG